MTLADFQRRIESIYFERDNARGLGGTFMWFVEEVGELSTALREGDKKAAEAEFADVLAWLMTLASISGVEMETAVRKYSRGCPSCHKTPCACANPKP
jgi:NTP pyrophosphatase (non-canonical NTP hydrolase)